MSTSVDMAGDSYASIVIKTFHALVTVLSVVMTIVLISSILMAKKDHTQFFITNSFLSTYESITPLVSYTPLNKPVVFDNVRETYLNCLQESHVGVSNIYNCSPDSSAPVYRACLNQLNTEAHRIHKMVREIKIILDWYGSNVSVIAQLPSSITGSEVALRENLASPSHRELVKLQLSMQSTPVSISILDVIVKAESVGGVDGCARNARDMMAPGASPVYDVGPIFTYLWQCTSDFLVTEAVQKVAFEKCVPFDVWPSKDVMQTPYTLTLFGSYNHYFFLIIGGWLMSSFAVYTFPGLASGTTVNGKPHHWLARAGKAFVLFGFTWNCASIVIVLVRSFTPGENWERFPMTIQTVLVTFFFTVSATIYFGREVYELFVMAGDASAAVTKNVAVVTPQASAPTPPSSYADNVYSSDRSHASSAPSGTPLPPTNYGDIGNHNGQVYATASRYSHGRRYQNLSSYMRVQSASNATLVDAQYIPLVVPVWSDAWIFADAMLFLGIVGLSKDVVSADLVITVFCILMTSIVNSAMVRLLYEGYINEVPENSAIFEQFKIRTTPRGRDQTTIQSIRVMAMVANLTALLLAVMSFYLVLHRYGSETPMLYLLFTSLLPQIFWLLLTLTLDLSNMISATAFFDAASVCFAIQVLIKTSFMIVALTVQNKDYDLTIGNSDSLSVLLDYVNLQK